MDSFSCKGSTSAARLLNVGILLFRELEANNVLSYCGVNTNARVQLSLGHTALHCDTDSLSYFSSIGGKDMETNDLIVVGLVYEHLHVAVTAFWAHFIELPLKGLELGVEG